MLPACTVILYKAEPTVRVRTEPALREVIPTRNSSSAYSIPDNPTTGRRQVGTRR